jgi:ATP-dependent 26S proteasome regulatory subunit
MRTKLANYIRSGHAGVYLVSHEEARVEAELKGVADKLKRPLFAWSATRGLVNTADGSGGGANDPLEAVEAVNGLPEDALVLLADFHLFLQDGNPVLIRAIKDALVAGKAKGRVLIVLGCRQVLPPELEREFVLLDFGLPGKEQLGLVLDGICKSAKLKKPEGDERDQILDAATGMTCTEAENAYALAVIESKKVDPAVVTREKASTVKKNGLLEVVQVRETLNDIGGLDVLKNWLLKRKDAFSQRAREYGLPNPKGLLIVGVPGTGKSLTAKATASVFGRPLLKLDAGKLYGSLVGQSEGNLRAVIQTAEAIAPCVLFIDELEKGFAGSKSSGSTDGGTSSRVFGSFISWMQEKTAPVFVVATANDVTQLPPELLRKGRWDDLFFVDLPNLEEREAIWRIQIERHGRDRGHYDTLALAKASEGHTGAEIEQAVIDALYAAFAAGREPGMPDLLKALAETVPLSKLMSEQIAGLRKWSQGRCRMATSPIQEVNGRKIAT